ncbi:MAG: cobalamin-dependent protein [Coprothermobacterota bacterium]|jgi:methanogenic corrinoid protein MtbC1|nr:cobalamin-dependent protein [Coprothermobacterota bacterium]
MNNAAWQDFEVALLAMDRIRARALLRTERLEEAVVSSLESLVIPSLEQIGIRWEAGEISLAQVYMAGRIAEELVDEFLPPMSPQRTDQPKIAIAVLEDCHALGKRIVISALRASGYELTDFGHGLTAVDLARRVKREGVQILLISVLMLHSALRVAELRKLLGDSGDCAGWLPPRLIVGGAPFLFDSRLWRDVGADAMGRNAAEAVSLVKEAVEEQK